jgi:peptidoglycan hydrolase-like protein with peptidoglycan-binding domain
MLGLNSQSAAVIRVQAQLRQLGYYKGPVDGFYGTLTRTAVVKFQQAKRLEPDGVVGIKTWKALQQAQPKSNAASSVPPHSAQKPLSQTSAQSDDEPFNISFNIPFDIRSQYLLCLGLAVVYLSGWGLIFRDVAKEVQGYKFTSSPASGKASNQDFEAAAKRIVAHTTSGQKVPVVVRYSGIAESGLPHKPTPSQAPQPVKLPAVQEKVAQAKASAQQHLAITSANAGSVQPLHNLFVGLDQPKPQGIAIKRHMANTPAVKPVRAKPKLEVVNGTEEETLVATLPVPSSQKAYTYALVDDAAGLFVLRGNQLRVINRLLRDCQFNERRVTVRRTDVNGRSVDKSFQLAIQQIKQAVRPEPLIEAVG